MRHPFELKIIEIADLEAVEPDGVRELTDEETKQISGGGKAELTTLAIGEEGGCPTVPPVATTRALGEEGGGYSIPPVATTLALGEEGGGSHYS